MATYSVRKVGGEEVARFSYLSGAKATCDEEAKKTGEIHYIVKEEMIWSSQTFNEAMEEESPSDRHSPIKFDR